MIAPNPTLPASMVMEFIAGARTLTVFEQAQLRSEYPLMWGLYFAPSGWLYGAECKREIRFSAPFLAGLS